MSINTTHLHRLKQPPALLPLCMTEMWERFGFYVLQGMLILVLTNHFNLSDRDAVSIVGEYGALAYIAPVIGGYYADHYLGFRYTVLVGAFFQCIGYICIATLNPTLLYCGLSLAILGNGFLKPNIASYLGAFYKKNDPNRSAGFTYYYMGINVGIFISTLTAGFIQQAWGWHVCFGTAAVGMLIGIAVFIKSFSRFGNEGLPVAANLIHKRTFIFTLASLLLCALVTATAYLLLQHPSAGNKIILVFGIVTLLYLIFFSYQYQGAERRHLLALIWLIVFAALFWGMYFEMFSVINLFVERNVNRFVFGIEIPPIAFMSLEAVFILILGLPLAALWKRLEFRQKSNSIATKFIFTFFILALAMSLLVFAIHHPTQHNLVFSGWMVLFYLLITLTEMLLSPNLLSAVSELSPPKLVGLMMGVQYMAVGFGSATTAYLGQIAAIPKGITNINITNPIYAHAFNTYAIICLATGFAALVSAPFIKRLIRE